MPKIEPMTAAEFDKLECEPEQIVTHFARIALALRRGEQAMELLDEIITTRDKYGWPMPFTELGSRAVALLKGASHE